VAVLAFTDQQNQQITLTATQIPRRLRDAYLQRIVQLLDGRDFGDGDVHRAARAAAGEILHGPRQGRRETHRATVTASASSPSASR
jgi:hypothetical protein